MRSQTFGEAFGLRSRS